MTFPAKITEFLIGVRAELRKVTWTTSKELIASTVVVVVTTLVVALFIGVVDYLMQLGLISGLDNIIRIIKRG